MNGRVSSTLPEKKLYLPLATEAVIGRPANGPDQYNETANKLQTAIDIQSISNGSCLIARPDAG